MSNERKARPFVVLKVYPGLMPPAEETRTLIRFYDESIARRHVRDLRRKNPRNNYRLVNADTGAVLA